MRRPTKILLAAGVAFELALGLFPPLRLTLAAPAGELVVGRTRHFFIFKHLGGAWTLDTGRFFVYAFLIAILLFAVAALEHWLHSQGAKSGSRVS